MADTDLVSEPAIEQAPDPVLLFSNTTTKLVILSVLTFGFYELYWSYKNWKAIKRMDARDISPFWRSWFIVFYVYYLFKVIAEKAAAKGFAGSPNVSTLACTYLALVICGSLSGRLDQFTGMSLLSNVLWFASFLTVMPLVEMQKAVNAHNHAIDPGYMPVGRFSAWDIAFVVIGGAFMLLSLAGLFLPT